MTSEIEKDQASGLETVLFGLKVWAAEMRHLVGNCVARFEVSRLHKRLDQEYTRLGRIAENPRGRKEEKELCLAQISFLKDEIATLEAEKAQAREERLARMRGEAD